MASLIVVLVSSDPILLVILILSKLSRLRLFIPWTHLVVLIGFLLIFNFIMLDIDSGCSI